MTPTDTAPTIASRTGHIIRPDPVYLRYALIVSALTGPLFPFVFLSMYLHYITLRYRFDADADGGVWMAQGILFKKEVSLAYRRIQDIHVSRNIIERWMGLARISVQTASASATPEMTIEGLLDADELRDFLYQRMRGAKGFTTEHTHEPSAPATAPPSTAADSDEALALLREIRDAIADVRERLPRGDQP